MEIDQRNITFSRQCHRQLERFDGPAPAIQLHERCVYRVNRRNLLQRTHQFGRVDPLEILVDDQLNPVKAGFGR